MQKAAVMEVLMEVPKVYKLAEGWFASDSMTAVMILEQLAKGPLKNWVFKKRDPKWMKWDSTKTSLRAHIGALKLEAEQSGCSDEALRSGFVTTTTGVPLSIATNRIKTEPNVRAKQLMQEVLDNVENNVTEVDVDMLDDMLQNGGETTDKLGERVYENCFRVMSAQGVTDLKEIEKKARRIFVKALRPPIGPRVRAGFPETWQRAVLIARQVESEVGVYQGASKIGAVGGRGGGRVRGSGRGGSLRGGVGRGGRSYANVAHNNNNNNSGAASGSGRGGSSSSSSIICHVCSQPGHVARNCPNKKRACYTCGDTSHIAANCPNKPAPGGGAAVQNNGVAAAPAQ